MADQLISLVNQAGFGHVFMVPKGLRGQTDENVGVARKPEGYSVRKQLMKQYFFADKDL